MRRSFTIIATILLLALVSSTALAQNTQITVKADVDPDNAIVGEQVTYTISITGTNLPDSITPDVPGLNDPGLQLLANRRNRTMMSGSSFTVTINGRTVTQDKNAEEQVIIEYVLRATRPGTFHIGPASMDIGGNTYKSNEVAFSVSTEPVAPQDLRARGEVFLHVEVSPKRVYVGQQVTLKYYLYVRAGYDVGQLLNWDMPKMDSFIKNDLEKPARLRPTGRSIGGQPYDEVFLGRQVAFPITSGARTIGPMKLEYVQNIKGKFHPIFGSQPYQQKGEAESEPVTIEALPLPEAGRPADFSGAVGRFQVAAEVDRREARVGESITLNVRLTGTGNLRSAADPILNIPNSFQTYPPEKQDQFNMVGEEVQGGRQLKVILVPQQEGTFAIGPVTFKYFDPISGSYQEAGSQPVSITIGAGVSALPRPNITLPESEEIKLLGHDIRYIKPDAENLADYSKPFYARPWYWAIHGLPVLMLAGAILLRKRQDKLRMDLSFARRVRARATANKKLAGASGSLKALDISAFYLELNEALLGFIADHLDLMAAGLTSQDMSSRMAQAGVPPELVSRAKSMLERCDAARYAPSALSRDSRPHDLEETRALVEELGRVFEKGKRQ